MIQDQADQLRQLVRQHIKAAAPVGPAPGLLAVSGGKGGIGTTTVALNLAAALTRQGSRTVLVDADLNRGGGFDWRSFGQQGSLVDVLAGRRTIHEVLERGPAGVLLLPGAWAPAGLADISATAQQRLIAELKQLGLHADAVVVDLGSGRNHFVRRFWQVADVVLLVTGADPPAVMESYAAIKVLLAGDAAVNVQTLVNFAEPEVAADAAARVGHACRRFLGMRVGSLGHLPHSVEVEEAAASGLPLANSASVLAGRLDEVAEALAAQLHRPPSKAPAPATRIQSTVA